ncbi:hypothetical protein K2X33_04965 [bacterium]|nr:hypothetical protein [bacterium]
MKWAWRVIYPFFFLAVCAAALVIPKVRQGLLGRRGLKARARDFGAKHPGAWWFHFASSGEFEQALPIVEELRRRSAEAPIFLTCFSPSGRKAILLEQSRREKTGLSIPWTAWDYLPLDFPWAVKGFLKGLRPRAAVFLNREFWPEMLTGLGQQNIPTVFLSVFVPQGTARTFGYFEPWLKQATLFATVDELSAQRFAFVPSHNRAVLGDPRIDRVLARRARTEQSPRSVHLPRPLFVGASLWQQDFEALKPGLLDLVAAQWSVVLVPHEPKEGFLRILEAWAQEQGLKCERWSRRSSDPADIFLVDSVGWLAELYREADLAFVGGSFVARVHNVLEPAVYGVPVLVGPHHHNSLEATEMASLQNGGVTRVSNAADFSATVKRLIQNARDRKGRGQAALDYVQSRKGAALRCADRLLRLPISPN